MGGWRSCQEEDFGILMLNSNAFATTEELPELWKEAFREVVSQADISEPLKDAALSGQLGIYGPLC